MSEVRLTEAEREAINAAITDFNYREALPDAVEAILAARFARLGSREVVEAAARAIGRLPTALLPSCGASMLYAAAVVEAVRAALERQA